MKKATLTLFVLIALIFAALPVTPARAGTTITVDTTLDDFTTNGNCSLREAIQAANNDTAVDACPAGSGPDIINLPAGSYSLTRTGRNEDLNATGDLDIRSSVVINGADRTATVVNANGIDRVFHLLFNTTQVTLYNLTVTGGANEPNNLGGPLYSGGGIQVFTSVLTLNQVTVSGNVTTSSGGGIYNNGGTVTLFSSLVSGNTAVNPQPNITAQGGGIYNNGYLTLNDSMVLDNTVDNTAGGIYTSFSLTINNSTVSGNLAGTNGGGLYIYGGTADITNSTISNNTATSFLGGGLWIYYEQVPTVNISHSTVTGNIAGTGGGIYNSHLQARPVPDRPEQNQNIFIKNSIIALNTAPIFQNCGASAQAELPLSHGYNIDSGVTCGFADPTDLLETDPLIGPLQDNGGPTLTHALKSTSPAIGAGNCTTVPGAVISTDQRGISRPQPTGGACDSGAYEYISGADADLSLTKTGQPIFALTGSPITYTLSIANNGPNAVTGIVITDTLPAGVAYNSYSGSGWACSSIASQVVCSHAGIPPGSAPALTLHTTAPLTAGVITNTAVLSADMLDPDLTNNLDTATTTIETVYIPHADLQVTLTDAPDPVTTGGVYTYTASVANLGPDVAAGLVLTGTLPASVTGLVWSAPGWSCTFTTPQVTCQRASLVQAAVSDLAFRVTAPATAALLSGSVEVSASTNDPALLNNIASTTTTVQQLYIPSADLSVTVLDAPDPVIAGQPLTYTVSVSNLGPDPASNLVLTDTLPAGAALASWTTPGWICAPSTGQVVCQSAQLAAFAGATLVFHVTAPSTPGQISNGVTLDSATIDPTPGNNAASASTTVQAAYIPTADLTIALSDDPDPVTAGGVLTYTTQVANLGPDDASHIVYTNTLPTGATFIGWQGTGWSCTHLASTVRCTLASLAPAGSADLILNVLAPLTQGVAVNHAQVVSDQPDPLPANNTATTSTTVNSLPQDQADLDISISDGQTTATPGEPVTYTITVTNLGPLAVSQASVTAALPPAITTPHWTCTSAAGACSAASGSGAAQVGVSLPVGGSAIIIQSGTLSPDASGLLTSNAAVAPPSGLGDPVPGNNTATDDTGLLPAADLALTLIAVPQATTGQPVTVTLGLTNQGPSTASGILAVLQLPAGVGFTGGSPACTQVGSQVQCAASQLSPGSATNWNIVLVLDTPGAKALNATVASQAADPHLLNNAAQTSVTGQDPRFLLHLPFLRR